MIFKIIPFQGTDTIKLGMNSEEIADVAGTKPEKIRKGGCDQPVDAYEFCFVYFDGDGCCNGIEFFKPAAVTLNGKELLGQTAADVKALFLELDKQLIVEDSDVFYSMEYSIGIYGEEGIVETVYIGPKDCYKE